MKRIRIVGLLLALFIAAGAGAQALPTPNTSPALVVFPSAARTATTVVSADIVNSQYSQAQILINVSAFTSGTYTPTIQGKDPVSGNYYTLLTGIAISGTGETVLHIGAPVPLANAATGAFLPQTWRISLAGASTPSMTFSVGAFLR